MGKLNKVLKTIAQLYGARFLKRPFVKNSLVPVISTIKKWVGRSVGIKKFSVRKIKRMRASFPLKRVLNGCTNARRLVFVFVVFRKSTDGSTWSVIENRTKKSGNIREIRDFIYFHFQNGAQNGE